MLIRFNFDFIKTIILFLMTLNHHHSFELVSRIGSVLEHYSGKLVDKFIKFKRAKDNHHQEETHGMHRIITEFHGFN